MTEPTRYPKNAAGQFYVENGCCIFCKQPHVQAPELMGFDEEALHCFFERQPETEEEAYHAIRAVWGSCAGCLRYGGNDPTILRRLIEIGEADACDYPGPSDLKPVLRNHVTFKVATNASDATELGSVLDLATWIRNYLMARSPRYEVSNITLSDDIVQFTYTWTGTIFHTLLIQSAEPNRWLVSHSPEPQPGSIAVSFALDDLLKSDARVRDICWYFAEEWNGSRAQWQETPY